MFKLNEKAPDFTLPKITGGEFCFSDDLKSHDEDHWHLIIFFRGSWCPACMNELDQLEKEQGYFNDKKVHLITVTHDEQADLEKMQQEHQFSFPVLNDKDFQFLKDYHVHFHAEDAPYEDHGTHGDPAYFLTDAEGRVLYQQRQTSPFGRPAPTELRKIIQYIRSNLKG